MTVIYIVDQQNVERDLQECWTPPTPTPPHTTTTGMFSGDETKCYLHLLVIFVLNDMLYIYDSTCFI